jgi:hypothetical protein
MQRSVMRWWLPAVLAPVLVATVDARVAAAQGCTSPERLTLAAVAGRSSPYFDLDRDAIAPRPGSVSVRDGFQVGGRGDISIAGPLRARVEAWTARWDVERRTFSPIDGQIETITSEGHVTASHFGASAGLRGGRAPLCWQVLVGGGLYALSFRDKTSYRPGVALTAGVDFPTGARGRVQIDVQLHLIDTKSRSPVASTTALAAALVAGWGIRF